MVEVFIVHICVENIFVSSARPGALRRSRISRAKLQMLPTYYLQSYYRLMDP